MTLYQSHPDAVHVGHITVTMTRDGGVIAREVEVHVDDRVVMGRGGRAVDALGAAMYAIATGVDEVVVDGDGEMQVVASRPSPEKRAAGVSIGP